MDLNRLQQINIESRYASHNVRNVLKLDILDDDDFASMIDEGVRLIEQYINQEYYKAKQARIDVLLYSMDIDAKDIVIDIFIAVLSSTGVQEIQAIIGRLTHILPYDDIFDSVKTLAEILAVVSDCGLYDFIAPRDSESGYLTINPLYQVEEETLQYMSDVKYLPPMICKPKEITGNDSSAHLTKLGDSIILGSGNHHDNYLALDVLNINNRIPLELDLLVVKEQEQPNKELITKEQKEGFRRLRQSSRDVYAEIIHYGNEFHLTNKYDKRGRFYTQGYHINIQSTEYKKASINLKNKLVIG